MEFLRFLAGLRNPVCDFFFSAITYLGGEILFIVIALVMFWCVSKKNGYYLLTVCFFGTLINQFLKNWFRIPRPWKLDPTFKPIENAVGEATGYSFPSGHTQNAVGTAGAIAYAAKKTWVRILAVTLAALVAFSRMYLGVHTPLDVGVSILIAVVLVFTVKPVIDRSEKNPVYMYVLLAVLGLLSLGYLLFMELYTFPADVDAENYAHGLKNAYTFLGMIVGMSIAYPIERRYIRFETQAVWYVQIVKVVLGFALVMGVKELLKVPMNAIFDGHPVAHAIRYMAMVLVAVLAYPLLFPLLRKLERKKKA